MNRFLIVLVFALILFSCKEESKKWTFEGKIELPEKVRPLALAKTGDDLWLSDPEQYRLLKIEESGKLLDSIVGIKRPMNIDFNKGKLYKIYVADAYNNRVQTFDFNGTILNVVGEADGFNVASAIAFDKDGFAVIDQENSRVLL